jgi:hypothetical protein
MQRLPRIVLSDRTVPDESLDREAQDRAQRPGHSQLHRPALRYDCELRAAAQRYKGPHHATLAGRAAAARHAAAAAIRRGCRGAKAE